MVQHLGRRLQGGGAEPGDEGSLYCCRMICMFIISPETLFKKRTADIRDPKPAKSTLDIHPACSQVDVISFNAAISACGSLGQAKSTLRTMFVRVAALFY